MVVVRSRYRNCIDMLMFPIEHLPEIFVVFRFRESFNGTCRAAVVHVAEIGNLRPAALVETIQVRCSFATHADAGDDKFITGRYEAGASQHMPWHHYESSRCRSSCSDEISTARTHYRLGLLLHFAVNFLSYRIYSFYSTDEPE